MGSKMVRNIFLEDINTKFLLEIRVSDNIFGASDSNKKLVSIDL